MKFNTSKLLYVCYNFVNVKIILNRLIKEHLSFAFIRRMIGQRWISSNANDRNRFLHQARLTAFALYFSCNHSTLNTLLPTSLAFCFLGFFSCSISSHRIALPRYRNLSTLLRFIMQATLSCNAWLQYQFFFPPHGLFCVHRSWPPYHD